jgi:undecaprenyl-diphosphatase
VDYALYHAINRFVAHHTWLGHVFGAVESWSIPVLAAATVGLWLFARPGSSRKWKLACASALASSAVALLLNAAIAHVWLRERPYAAHPGAPVWSARSQDPSFPSDHASAAFAIAFAVFLYDRLVGSLFLAAAVLISGGRVVVGVHYPGDVLAGMLVGLAVAVVVVRLARPLVVRVVRLVERVTDPVLAPVWRSRM